MSPCYGRSVAIRPNLLLATIGRRGGDEQVRTVDPLLAKQVLSQLSYAPISIGLFPSGESTL